MYTSMYSGFAEMSRDNYKQAVLVENELLKLKLERAKLKDMDLAVFDHEKYLPLQKQQDHHSVIVIVFSALAIEGYINYYAIKNLPDSYFEKHIEKIDTLSKWILLPKIIAGSEFPRESKAYSLLQQLIRDRNYLVHNKTSRLQVYDQKNDQLKISSPAVKMFKFSEDLFKKAKNAIDAMDELSIIMEELDQNEHTSFALDAMVGSRKKQMDEFGV